MLIHPPPPSSPHHLKCSYSPLGALGSLIPAKPFSRRDHASIQVEAAIAVQMMLSSKGEQARPYLEPQIREITLELLKIIRYKGGHTLNIETIM